MSAAAALRNESRSRFNLEHFSRKFNRNLFGSIHKGRVIDAKAIQQSPQHRSEKARGVERQQPMYDIAQTVPYPLAKI